MRIRALSPADDECYRTLLLSGLRETPTGFGVSYEEVLAESPDGVRARLSASDDPASRVFGAFAPDGTLGGVVGIRQQTLAKMRHRGTIGRMYVGAEYRRLGLARRLLESALAYARGVEGLEQLNLIVAEDNAAARRLYESVGFVPFGLEPREIKVDGVYYDSVHMWLRL